MFQMCNFGHSTVLTELSIAGNNLGPEGGKAMAEMLKFNTALTKLRMCDTIVWR